MIEAHPFITLLVFMVVFACYGAYRDMDSELFSTLALMIILVWGVWAYNIPDTPEQVAQAKAQAEQREAARREKETPKPLSQADGCTVYVFERQGREHFFTRCEKTTSTETNWTEGCGKGCSRPVRDSIVTPNH
jgi:hypothetical protein